MGSLARGFEPVLTAWEDVKPNVPKTGYSKIFKNSKISDYQQSRFLRPLRGVLLIPPALLVVADILIGTLKESIQTKEQNNR